VRAASQALCYFYGPAGAGFRLSGRCYVLSYRPPHAAREGGKLLAGFGPSFKSLGKLSGQIYAVGLWVGGEVHLYVLAYLHLSGLAKVFVDHKVAPAPSLGQQA
jgi:hypothetical protein